MATVSCAPRDWPFADSRTSAATCSAKSFARPSSPPACRTACRTTSLRAATWCASAGKDRFSRKPTLLTLHRQPAEQPLGAPLVRLDLRPQRVYVLEAPLVAQAEHETKSHRPPIEV